MKHNGKCSTVDRIDKKSKTVWFFGGHRITERPLLFWGTSFMQVAEFMNVETGDYFDTTVSPAPEGFVIDEDAEFFGPFVRFSDGTLALFKGIQDRAAI